MKNKRVPGQCYARLRAWFIATLVVICSVGLRGLEQTLVWTSPPAGASLLLNQPYPLAATSSSGLPVSYCVQSGPAVIVGGIITVTNVGPIVVIAEQSGNVEYGPASVVRAFNQSSLELVKRGGWSGTDTGGYVLGVQVVGDLAYVAGGYAGLHIIDVSDPAQPVRKARYELGGEARTVRVAGTLAYVAAGDAGLQILDVSNPASPVRVGSYDTSGSASDVELVGNIAYVADGDTGLQIIDVSDPTLPVWMGYYHASWSTFNVQVVGNLAYVVDRSAGLQIVDVVNPDRPIRLGGYYTSGSASSVQVVGNLAYLVDKSAGLQIVDVSNPAKPARLGGYATGGSASGVRVVGNLAYVAVRSGGVQVIDVSQPANPVRLCGYQTSGYAGSVEVMGKLAYVAEGDAGLEILGFADARSSTVSATKLSWQPTLTLINGKLGFNLTGTPGESCVVELSTDLKAWEPMATNQTPFRFEIPILRASRRVFYRAVGR